jgi:hypothetical protein
MIIVLVVEAQRIGKQIQERSSAYRTRKKGSSAEIDSAYNFVVCSSRWVRC